ncbi:hypothetical protein DdX_03011 [Ditylenchus destructor]|uniref:Uncharacterized protein n=1 Tax=Ditylenchus destructor TaxID=166010 RepID=A0AAD4NF60_9BILA|nr:hypothetical protein DdX_03011 [Ditylenchus destructor]
MDEWPKSGDLNLKGTEDLPWEDFFEKIDQQLKSTDSTALNSLRRVTSVSSSVATLPYKKALCYGSCPTEETEQLRIVRCSYCDLIVKVVGYGHHMRLRHNYRPPPSSASNSGDDCQDFLLSPPHIPALGPSTSGAIDDQLETDLPITGDDLDLARPSSSRSFNSTTNDRICSPPYYVEQCKDLVLVLSKRSPNKATTVGPTRAVTQKIGQKTDESGKEVPTKSGPIRRRYFPRKRRGRKATSRKSVKAMDAFESENQANRNHREESYSGDRSDLLAYLEEDGSDLAFMPRLSPSTSYMENELDNTETPQLFATTSRHQIINASCQKETKIQSTTLESRNTTVDARMARMRRTVSELQGFKPPDVLNHRQISSNAQCLNRKSTSICSPDKQSSSSDTETNVLARLLKLPGLSVTALSPQGKRSPLKGMSSGPPTPELLSKVKQCLSSNSYDTDYRKKILKELDSRTLLLKTPERSFRISNGSGRVHPTCSVPLSPSSDSNYSSSSVSNDEGVPGPDGVELHNLKPSMDAASAKLRSFFLKHVESTPSTSKTTFLSNKTSVRQGEDRLSLKNECPVTTQEEYERLSKVEKECEEKLVKPQSKHQTNTRPPILKLLPAGNRVFPQTVVPFFRKSSQGQHSPLQCPETKESLTSDNRTVMLKKKNVKTSPKTSILPPLAPNKPSMIVHGSSGTRFVSVSGSTNSLIHPAIGENSANIRKMSSSTHTLTTGSNVMMQSQSSTNPMCNVDDTPTQAQMSGRLLGTQPGRIAGDTPHYVTGSSSPQIGAKDQPMALPSKLPGSRPLVKTMRQPVALKSAAVASGSSPLAGSMESISRDSSYKGKPTPPGFGLINGHMNISGNESHQYNTSNSGTTYGGELCQDWQQYMTVQGAVNDNNISTMHNFATVRTNITDTNGKLSAGQAIGSVTRPIHTLQQYQHQEQPVGAKKRLYNGVSPANYGGSSAAPAPSDQQQAQLVKKFRPIVPRITQTIQRNGAGVVPQNNTNKSFHLHYNKRQGLRKVFTSTSAENPSMVGVAMKSHTNTGSIGLQHAQQNQQHSSNATIWTVHHPQQQPSKPYANIGGTSAIPSTSAYKMQSNMLRHTNSQNSRTPNYRPIARQMRTVPNAATSSAGMQSHAQTSWTPTQRAMPQAQSNMSYSSSMQSIPWQKYNKGENEFLNGRLQPDLTMNGRWTAQQPTIPNTNPSNMGGMEASCQLLYMPTKKSKPQQNQRNGGYYTAVSSPILMPNINHQSHDMPVAQFHSLQGMEPPPVLEAEVNVTMGTEDYYNNHRPFLLNSTEDRR